MSTALGDLVATKITRYLKKPKERERAVELLAQYGRKPYEAECDRVRLAILKLSGGQIGELEKMVAAAKLDYRDVIAWAEYPEEFAALGPGSANLSDEDRRRLAELRKRDEGQYGKWLAE